MESTKKNFIQMIISLMYKSLVRIEKKFLKLKHGMMEKLLEQKRKHKSKLLKMVKKLFNHQFLFYQTRRECY